MKKHLPECHFIDISYGRTLEGICICHALRACEQRVNGHRLSYENGVEVGYDKGYAAGLDAAREAVNALASTTVEFHGPLPVVHNVRITDALAAIDALRGES